jgi:pyridoxal phosphate enzyme (YggS family)
MDLTERYKSLQNKVLEACQRSDRDASGVTLVAVTKTFAQDDICKACALGLTDIGENRVQEVVDKFTDGEILRQFPATRLHMIGHLQSNKVRKVVPLCATIDSVDSVALAEAIEKECEAAGRRMRILLEVNSSGEPQKFGIRAADLFETIEKIIPLSHLDLAGLMTVGPLTEDPRGIRSSFRILRNAFEEIRDLLNPPMWRVLSMGMSGDYEIAIEEGATEIRVGTALFGNRSAK